jgi:hypothetical protein
MSPAYRDSSGRSGSRRQRRSLVFEGEGRAAGASLAMADEVEECRLKDRLACSRSRT